VVPGISVAGARALLERFGSVNGVLVASVEELMEVPGIGPQRALALRNAFS
jgi:ERCC4-type nuclease